MAAGSPRRQRTDWKLLEIEERAGPEVRHRVIWDLGDVRRFGFALGEQDSSSPRLRPGENPRLKHDERNYDEGECETAIH